MNSKPAPQLRDDFEGTALEAFWLPGDHGSGRYEPDSIVLTSEHARSGRQCARITVRTGDIEQTTESGKRNERAELDSGKHALMGQSVWCGFSMLVPEGFPIVDTRLVLSQWKQSGLEGSPVVAQRYVAGRHYLTIRDLDTEGSWRETVELPSLRHGEWNDLVFHVRFAADDSGLVEVWMNGDQVANVAGPTASLRGRPEFYHKVGLYRDRMEQPMTVYVDSFAMGEERRSVESTPDGR